MTRITLAQVVYSQGHNGQFGNMAELIAAGVIPKELRSNRFDRLPISNQSVSRRKVWYTTPNQPNTENRAGFRSIWTLPDYGAVTMAESHWCVK